MSIAARTTIKHGSKDSRHFTNLINFTNLMNQNNFFSNLLKISNTDSIYIWERIENHIKII
ncbi:hypothetical protein CE91St24_13140 [Odoribacteraceae bacterium]|nr:hypothetical protein CE91St21_31130 [Odoribacteraceae bacterium]GKH94543.1 hypothetical protein CE91St23_30390 [Odoribacteraceae bacterium]GKI00715.1 hypothetical protein CE91St22_45920 [Odoribacteraceae bacterium]GKI02039.1 hypothetical protein CE91St24_13140 [Odoribacteraceae bacterium]